MRCGHCSAFAGSAVSESAPHPAREGQTFACASTLSTYASFVKLPDPVFALPFAMIGVILASYSRDVSWPMLGWTILAFTAARFAAMGFNRNAHREFAAPNPRTMVRELPRVARSVPFSGVRLITPEAFARLGGLSLGDSHETHAPPCRRSSLRVLELQSHG